MTVSVVIPARVREPFLGAAIDSVLAQGDLVGEVLVCTSERDCPSALAARREDPRVALVVAAGPLLHEKLNAGVARARGEWLAFLDADDAWPGGRIRTALAALGADPELRMCQGRQHPMTQDGRLFGAAGPAPLLGTTVIDRQTAAALGEFAPGVATAMDWLLRARSRARHVMLDDVLLHRRVHEHNMTRTQSAELHAAYLALARRAIHRPPGAP